MWCACLKEYVNVLNVYEYFPIDCKKDEKFFQEGGTRIRAYDMAQVIAVLSTIPKLSHHLRTHLPNLIIYDVLSEKDNVLSKLNKAEIMVADCDLLIPYLGKLPKLQWVQSTWAGLDYLNPFIQDKQFDFILSRFSDKSFGLAMSEYVITQIVNFERDQKQQYENQKNSDWITDGKIKNHRLIRDLNIGILGLGNIGKFIAQHLKIFGATIWGMTRTPLKEHLDYIDEHRTTDLLPDILKNCDYIINVLPSTKNTIGLLNGTILEHCKDHNAVFINIGRGTVIREADLLNALERKWISAAILDVFQEEPLPKNSKLWNLSNVTISPHISGVTRPQDVASLFAENYAKYKNGESIPNSFNYQTGY
ncbi:glyoxylate/hydroxypyruvate reductase A-like isoform X3 [Vespula pensylvanica]|uniref:glyoxylate/hydroxypyruvate reductase A-like isoform X2 n=1 Tax=Vespula pensylvanica TaxID=30213 RepID=UPI001CBA39CE|nr:glyoxylate/hydroxypyruvate reductase A-like isoform X2 [Vespula pensylvanica]XP_043663400.1 glyoxylate/hydroxypyruvate reductase A-like isoform X3 [Vespula pensylvanica]